MVHAERFEDQAAWAINLSCPANAKATTNSELMINLKTATAVSPDVLVSLLPDDRIAMQFRCIA